MNYLFLIITLAAVIAALVIAGFTGFHLSDEGYKRLKWLVIRWEFIVVFVGVLVKTFGFPYGLETVIVVAALGSMLAGFLGIGMKNYDKLTKNIEEPSDSFSELYYTDEELAKLRESLTADEVDENV